ncbi:MAG TPA: AMP-binding protein, partial [Rhizomicrobium sp.]|nr:AMP-binding protein [Rhizomicrobium sp.]
MHPSLHAARLPDKPALIMAGTGETVTYSQLDARSNQGAHLFRTLGLTTGDGIAIFSENNARFLDICWAAQRAGLYFTCISSRLTAGEIAYIVKDCGAKALIASHTLAKAAGETAPLIEDVKLFMLGGTIPGFESYEAATAAMPQTPIADETSGTDMLYSSGTTGRPKGIRSPLSGMPIDTPSPLLPLVMMLFGMNEDTIYLSTAPLYHAAPLRYSMSVQR